MDSSRLSHLHAGLKPEMLVVFMVRCRAQEDKITMLYEVREGPCLESFGIHVAAMAGFPKRVIREAKRKAAALENFEDVMERTGQVLSGGAPPTKRPRGEGVAGTTAVHASKLHRLVDMFKVMPCLQRQLAWLSNETTHSFGVSSQQVVSCAPRVSCSSVGWKWSRQAHGQTLLGCGSETIKSLYTLRWHQSLFTR